MSLLSRLFSAKQTSQKQASAIGAYVGDDPYRTYATTLKWILETKTRLPNGSFFEISSSMREEAFNADPLLKGIITPFLKNSALAGYSIQTVDNKKFAPAIKDIRTHLREIGLLDAYREDFIDYAIVHGHSYRRKDPDADAVESLAPLRNSTVRTYQDPWDSTFVAYHQKINIIEAWSDTATATTEYNSWFIPDGRTYVQGEMEDPRAREIFDAIAKKYNITDTINLRIDSADRIIAMHRVEPGEPAPIDSALLAIWLKRLLLSNSPNIIFRVLSPFVHIKNGLVIETTDNGEKRVITTVPEQPPEEMAETDPEMYRSLNSSYQSWVQSCKTAAADVLRSLKDGGIFASGPDTELQVVESGRSFPSKFIKEMIDMLDQEIGQAFGFPVALVKANGSELATSRTILELFNTTYAGVRHDYEVVADELIREKFAGKSWTFSIPDKEGGTETGTFTFEEMECRFQLDTVDVKERLSEAQAKLTDAQTLQAIKAIGAGKADIQALGDEAGFGVLDLDNFDSALADTGQPFGQEDSVKSTAKDELKPSEADESDLMEDLLKAYRDIRKDAEDIR